MEDNSDEDENDVENQKRYNLTEEADTEFSKVYGFLDLGMQVARESGVSYFEIIEQPCVHVLALSNYLIERVKKIERNSPKPNGSTK
jgi:hypothetical protein